MEVCWILISKSVFTAPGIFHQVMVHGVVHSARVQGEKRPSWCAQDKLVEHLLRLGRLHAALFSHAHHLT